MAIRRWSLLITFICFTSIRLFLLLRLFLFIVTSSIQSKKITPAKYVKLIEVIKYLENNHEAIRYRWIKRLFFQMMLDSVWHKNWTRYEVIVRSLCSLDHRHWEKFFITTQLQLNNVLYLPTINPVLIIYSNENPLIHSSTAFTTIQFLSKQW